MHFLIFLIKMSFHKASWCWQHFKREGKSPDEIQNSSFTLFVIYCLWKSGIRILFVVEMELNGAYDIVVYRSLIVRGMICCSFVASNGAFV